MRARPPPHSLPGTLRIEAPGPVLSSPGAGVQDTKLILLKGEVLPGACGAQGWPGEPHFPGRTPDSVG